MSGDPEQEYFTDGMACGVVGLIPHTRARAYEVGRRDTLIETSPLWRECRQPRLGVNQREDTDRVLFIENHLPVR